MSDLNNNNPMFGQNNFALGKNSTNDNSRNFFNPLLKSDFSEAIGQYFMEVARKYLHMSVTFIPISLLLILSYWEVKTKMSSTALRILLNKDRSAWKKTCVINTAQSLLLFSLVYLGLNSPELQALSFYVLIAKLIQTNRDRLKLDLPCMVVIGVFLLIRPQSTTAVLEPAGQGLTELTVNVLPVLFLSCLFVLTPLIIPVVAIVFAVLLVCWFLRALVILRRKFPEDFDFLVTLAISVLVWKTVRRELKYQIKHLNQSSLSSSPTNTAAGLLDSHLGNIIQVGPSSPGFFGRLEHLDKPREMAFLEFFKNNYRMLDVLSSLPTEGGCKLTVSQSPSVGGVKGHLMAALYRVYVWTVWALPESFKVYLPSFGFNTTTIVISSLADCAQFNRLTLLEEKNNQL